MREPFYIFFCYLRAMQEMNESFVFFTRTQVPYITLLERIEWKEKRERILIRDDYRCQMCGVTCEQAQLHVHHKHYIEGLDPWEYKDSELVTFCETCHSHFHHLHTIPYYRRVEDSLVRILRTPCRRCDGSGYFPEYRHIEGGVCFRCRGQKYEESIEKVKKYADEHNIQIESLFDGFRPITSEALEEILEILYPFSEFSGRNILSAVVHYTDNKVDSTQYYLVEMLLNDGMLLNAYLAHLYKAVDGERLDHKDLRFRIGTRQNGSHYLIVKDGYTPLDNFVLHDLIGKENYQVVMTKAEIVSSSRDERTKEILLYLENGDTVSGLYPDYTMECQIGDQLDINSLKIRKDRVRFLSCYSIRGSIIRQ